MDHADPHVILYAVQVITVIGLAVVARARLRRDPRIGRPLFVEFDSGGVKPVLFAVQVGLLVIALQSDGFPALFTGLTFYGTGVLTWLSPGMFDRACGEEGVMHGWTARRYEDLEAWRLRDGHLSVPLLGQWTRVDVPHAKRARLRSILALACPGREVVGNEVPGEREPEESVPGDEIPDDKMPGDNDA